MWGAGCAGAPPPVVLADGREDVQWPDLSDWAARPTLQAVAGAARTYWSGRDPSFEEEFYVMAVAHGSFTEPGAGQDAVLYLMSSWPRCCPKMGLAILEGEHVVRNIAFEDVQQRLSASPDLDGDGLDELVFVGSFGMGGDESTGMTLASFKAGQLTPVAFASIAETSCAAGGTLETAARISALPGPELIVERYEATCERTDRDDWLLVGGPEPLAFESPTENPYVEVPGI